MSQIQHHNPELDEVTATALCIQIHNHIEAMKAWERKLRLPYMPTTHRHYSLTPIYPKPTLATAMHVLEACSHARLSMGKLVAQYRLDVLKAANEG